MIPIHSLALFCSSHFIIEIDELVEEIILELGLEDCADTLLGNGGLIKGVSGGEMKRTSVGVELVVRPTMIVFDEPTSALDSFSAEKLVHVLKRVATAGSSVLFTIHQPPSAVFNLFDHLILLNKGRVMFNGQASQVQSFFELRGYPNPTNYNPADWILTIAQAVPEEELEQAGFFPENHNNSKVLLDESENNSTNHNHNDSKSMEHVRLGTEISMLFKREMANLVRDKASMVARIGISIIFNLLFGFIFYGVGRKDSAEPVVSTIF